ncbi:MAG: hypothetical protein QXR96_01940 [Candidatus Woesearchaeota archaeon]
MLYANTNQQNLYQRLEEQITTGIQYLNEKFEYAKTYFINFYNNLLLDPRSAIANLSYIYEKLSPLSNYLTKLENLINLFRVLFAKQNQKTIKTPGNGHAGNSNGNGSKKPKATPDKRKGGQNGPPQK